MTPQLEEKLSRAKAKLLVEYPYFGTLAAKLDMVVNDDLESFKSDGKKVEFREEYLLELSTEETAFILANGAMHKALAHEARKNRRSGWLWRMATDIAINDMLLQNGMQLPYGAQYRKRFSGMYAEEIYAELKSDILRDEEELEYEADESDDVEPNDSQQQEPKEEQLCDEAQMQEELLQEYLDAQEAISLLEEQFSRNEADLPATIERFFTLDFKGKINWREELKEALQKYFYDDYTMLPPSKKLLYEGIYLPSSTSNRFRLFIAVDSSGSVDEELLNLFLNEVAFLMEMIENYEIELFVCDTKIHTHRQFYPGETLEVELKGGGATDFRPVFEEIEKNFFDCELLLYFTDLEGIFPDKAPNYAVKWVSPKVKEIPFGELILLEE